MLGCTTDSRPSPAAPTSRAEGPSDRAAIIQGRSLRDADLFDRLAEAAGAEVLTEIVLEQRLELELRRAGLEIGPAEFEKERDLIVQAIAAADPSADPEALAFEVRARRGLGPQRFEKAVWRNAALRSLVGTRDADEPSSSDIERVIAARHGPARRVRLIVLPTERQAADVYAELTQAEPAARIALIAAKAAESSLDTSASRGGLYERLGLEDQRLPQAIRSAARRTAPGELAPVVSLDGGFAVMLVEATIEADTIDRSRVSQEIHAELLSAAEQRAMDLLAAELVEGAEVLITDPSLRWSWDNAR